MTDLSVAQHRARVRLARSLEAVTVGFERTTQRAKAEVAPLEPGNMAHAVQLDVRGEAGSAVATWDLPVTWWRAPFLSRIEAEDDETLTLNPQFGFGYELASDGPVMLTGCVREWRENDKGLIDSALVRLMAVSPGASAAIPFRAVAHLTFTGFAAPVDDDDDGVATPGGSASWPGDRHG